MREIRNLNYELRASKEINRRRISGYALLFDTESNDLGGFIERIDRASLEDVLERSDVFCLLNHNKERGVLARSKYGNGSLTLEVDEIGLRYSFEAPNTSLGDEVLEGIKRGDITSSSFAFNVDEDIWEELEDGRFLRTIKRFGELFDVSPVYQPAYEETSVQVDTRGMEKLQNKTMKEEKREVNLDEVKTELKEELFQTVAEKVDEAINDAASSADSEEEAVKIAQDLASLEEELLDHIDNLIDMDKEENSDEEDEDYTEMNALELADEKESARSKALSIVQKAKTEKRALTKGETRTVNACKDKMGKIDTEIKERRNKKPQQNITMKNETKQFSIVDAVLAKSDNRNLEGANLDLHNTGISELRKMGKNVKGMNSFVIPSAEARTLQVNSTTGVGLGNEIVATDVMDLTLALRGELALLKAGATFYTGLTNNLILPYYTGTEAVWADEVECIVAADGAFTQVDLSPKRLVTELRYSQQFLLQDGINAEAAIRQDLINSMAVKLEQTILDDQAGTTKRPQGILNLHTPTGITASWADFIKLEYSLRQKNINGPFVYVMSPATAGELKLTPKEAGYPTYIIDDNNMINGIPVIITSNVEEGYVLLAKWDDLVIAQWGGYEITVDPYTRAQCGEIRLVINAYFDSATRRTESFAFGELS